jgi:hypothetical protein
MYDGQWVNGKQEGVGIYVNNKSVEKYGRWLNGKRIEWLDKSKYLEL